MLGSLTRSFGVDGTDDWVVELNADGRITFRKEPVDRKLRRGEKLPECTLNVRDVINNISTRPAKEIEVSDILENLLAQLPISKFEEDTPKNVVYNMKVWLMRELRRVTSREQNLPEESTQ